MAYPAAARGVLARPEAVDSPRRWAAVLRPARAGAAYLAARTGARLLPVGLDGLVDILPALRRGRRAQVTVRIGHPFGPFPGETRGREAREGMDAIGREIMRQIAQLIPPERHGCFSQDSDVRAAAADTEAYPWDEYPET